MQKLSTWVVFVAVVLSVGVGAWSQEPTTAPASAPAPAPGLTQEPTLYMVGYAHLDTQWRWCYPEVIEKMIPATMKDNFRLFEKYPDYIFNFSGANHYRMMKEYHPADYEKVKKYVAAGRWFPCGSSMEECDAVVPNAESLIRQVLYGNSFFRRELNQASAEFILPDCFGFPASLPTILSHCGLKGFSTQKLTWGSAVGIPFHVGVWEGPDGTGLVCALDPGDYTAKIAEDLSLNEKRLQRIQEAGKKSGLYVDYGYFGIPGDRGGAPTEESVQWLEKSVKGSGPLRVLSSTAERMFLDIPQDKVGNLPRFRGDLLLTEHSAGSITSQGYVKRWNRQAEVLADAAERASVMAEWLGGPAYPRERLNEAWALVMAAQFHDILPGTSLPKAYEYSWNDQLLSLNQFSGVVENAVGAIAAALDTQTQGAAVVVYNQLSISRQDVVEARVTLPGTPKAVRVVGPDGKEMPAQILSSDQKGLKLLFVATVPPVGFAVYDIQASEAAPTSTEIMVSASSLENARYRVKLNANGDVAGIFDKEAGREMLSAPMRLAFMRDFPAAWPAWNIDWADVQAGPQAYVAGPATVKIIENGPVRVALQVVRDARGSHFEQTVRLSAGDSGNRIEFSDTIEWQSQECNLKASFPLSVANPQATYNWGVGTVQRGNNDPKKYEVPAHQWFDLTDAKGDYGVTVLSDCKYGSDKPDDQTLRLTLLRTPGSSWFEEQATQDWGRHEILYGLAGHVGDWRKGRTDWQAQRLNQPLLAFQTTAHAGPLGKSTSLLKVSTPSVRVLAVKKAEDRDEIIVRLVELDGQVQKGVRLQMFEPLSAAGEVNGQEQPIGSARLDQGELVTDLKPFGLRSFAVKLGSKPKAPGVASVPLTLPLDRCVTSTDGQKIEKGVAGMDQEGRCLPAELFPREVAYRGVTFKFGPHDGRPNAAACRGQVLDLPTGDYNRVYLLAAAADGDQKVTFRIDDQAVERTIQQWSGYIGSWDLRVWRGRKDDQVDEGPWDMIGLRPAYLKTAPVAWFCSHHHDAAGENQPYEYSYVFACALDLPKGAKKLTLPKAESVYVFAASIAQDPTMYTRPARPLMDELRRDGLGGPEIIPAAGEFSDVTPVSLKRSFFGCDDLIHYTLDGSEPTAKSPLYEGPFLLRQVTTVKARVIDGELMSPVVEARLAVHDTTAPTISGTQASTELPTVIVSFSEAIEKASAEKAENYKLEGGPAVKEAVQADERKVILTLDQPPAGPVKLAVSQVRDLAPQPNAITPASPQELRPLAPFLTVNRAASTATDRVEQSVTDERVLAGSASWTMNFWLRIDEPPADLTMLAGFGSAREGEGGSQRYIAKFPRGLHFWGCNVDVYSDTPLEVGPWQMLTATYDGRRLTLYKDGRQVTHVALTLSPAEPTVFLGPPSPWDDRGGKLVGDIERFTLWNEALDPLLIAGLHRVGSPSALPEKAEPVTPRQGGAPPGE